MPFAPRRPCSSPGCKTLVETGKCSAHKIQYERDRGSPTARGYGTDWRRFRHWYVQEIVAPDPFCQDCHEPFMSTSKIELHHVRKVAGHPELLYDTSNIRHLCHGCHSARTMGGE